MEVVSQSHPSIHDQSRICLSRIDSSVTA
uniref:Uncharacterized protein n=1 Tax=Rhizophora mucronata TaxID=61149 RepID=A0A2P2Q2D5_RHIMU